jgi:hypothetical protein
MTTLPEPPRTGLVDPRTGQLTREWVRFFDELRKAIVASLDEGVGGRLSALEMDTLFSQDGTGGASGGSSYNDTTVQARLGAIETELLFLNGTPPPQDYQTGQASTDDWDLDAVFNSLNDGTGQRLRKDLDGTGLDAALATDSAGAIQRLAKAVRDLETAQAMATDAAGIIAALAHRLRDLETETLFPR